MQIQNFDLPNIKVKLQGYPIDTSTQDFMTKLLMDLNLTKYESLVYINLLNYGKSSAKKLKNMTGIPYGKIYEVIDSLSNKGFISVVPESPLKCIPTEPGKIISNMKQDFEKKFDMIGNWLGKMNSKEGHTKENKQVLNSRDKSRVLIINNQRVLREKLAELVSKKNSVTFLRGKEDRHDKMLKMLHGIKYNEIISNVDSTLVIGNRFMLITEFDDGKMSSLLIQNPSISKFLLKLLENK